MTDKEIDVIYDRIDELFRTDKFSEVDDILKNLNVFNMDIDEMITYLTTTACAKSKLLNRREFFEKVRDRLQMIHSHKFAIMILSGLE